MAHDLFTPNGVPVMMYVGETPWHGLGTRLEVPPATAAEAMRAARLDWRVKKVPLYAIEGSGVVPVPDRLAVVPEDRWGTPGCPVFGVVGREYTPLQNLEAFEFFDAAIAAGGMAYHTAGALGDGARVWVLVKLDWQLAVTDDGDDMADKYLLLANGHDGRTSVQIKLTPVRVVCQNTLSLALHGSGEVLRVHHGRRFGGDEIESVIVMRGDVFEGEGEEVGALLVGACWKERAQDVLEIVPSQFVVGFGENRAGEVVGEVVVRIG